MRIAIASFLCISSLVAFTVAWNTSRIPTGIEHQTLIAYEVPSVPEEFKREFTYPVKFPAPGEPEFETDDGPSTYINWHEGGWADCLGYFYEDVDYDDEPVWQTTRTEWITIGAPDHCNDARIDGWFECATQLRALLRSTTEDDLRSQLTLNLIEVRKPSLYSCLGIGSLLIILSVSIVAFPRTKEAEPRNAREDGSRV